MVDGVRKFAEAEGARVVVVSAQVESELVDLDGDDKREFLESLGGNFVNIFSRESFDFQFSSVCFIHLDLARLRSFCVRPLLCVHTWNTY